jgi:hypothetical protein
MSGTLNWKELFYDMYEQNGFQNNEIEITFNIEMELRTFFDFSGIIPASLKLQNIECADSEIRYFWESMSNSAVCAHCGEISNSQGKEFYRKTIQDIPQNNKAVYHEILFKKYNCGNEACGFKTFEERFPEFTEEYARKTMRFKKYCVERALGCGCHRAEHEIKAEGAVVSNDSIATYVKTLGSRQIEKNLGLDTVRVLAVDDINLRKGDKASGCTVFVDGDTHKVLVIISGTTKDATKKIIERFQSAEYLSRDRASSYSSAGEECGKVQIADRFHLIENAHTVIKETLMAEMPVNIFIRKGDGWIMPDGGSINQTKITVDREQVEERVRLAGLSEPKAEKYRNTLKMLELSDQGLRSADIAHAMGISQNEVRILRRTAANTIENVNERIAKRFEYINSTEDATLSIPGSRAFKTLAGSRVEPSNASIVAPYRQTVIELWKAGGNKRTIYPALIEQGYKGSQNAIYQYILKLGKEEPEIMKREKNAKQKQKTQEENLDRAAAEMLPELSLEKVSRDTVYKEILKEASATRNIEDNTAQKETQETASSIETETSIETEASIKTEVSIPSAPEVGLNINYENSRSPYSKPIWELIHGAELAQSEKGRETSDMRVTSVLEKKTT